MRQPLRPLRPAAPRATALVTAVAFAFLALACATVPGTGRSQIMFISDDQEMALGVQAYEESLAEAQVVTSGADAAMVKRIGDRIAEAARTYDDPAVRAKAAKFGWEFKLIKDDKTVNAWALPGGKSAVYTGLLPITQDEDGLAVVLGHEVAHAIASHGAERMSHGLILDLGLSLGSKQLGEMTPGQQEAIMQGLGLGVMLPFSRYHESEADTLGLYLSAWAGYDPRASIGLWERMAAAGGGGTPEFLSTHPSESTRIADLQAIMPRALELYEHSPQR